MAITGVITSDVIEALTLAWSGSADPATSYDVDSVADTEADIDLDHAVYTTSQQNSDSQDSVGDNSNGLENPLVLQPTITFSYTTGHSTTHQETQGFTVGVTQDFDFKFAGSGEGTTISASGTFSWTEGTSDNETTSIQNSIAAPFDIPQYKIYEEKLFYTQEQVVVPYSAGVTATGSVTLQQGDQNVTIGNIFSAPSQGLTPPAMSGIDWTDFSTTDYTTGRYVLTGSLTAYDGGQSTTKIYDITNQTADEAAPHAQASLVADPSLFLDGTAPHADAGLKTIQAAYDAAVPVGVHYVLNDAGRGFLDTPFDDWVDGGAGNDVIVLSAGEDVAHAGGGDDTIEADGVGRSTLDGGAGNDVIALVSGAKYSEIQGGAGDDRISAYAPATMVHGGAGNDQFFMDARSGGSVITDTEGSNRLEIRGNAAPAFEHVGDNLYILMHGAGTYDRTQDIVWVDFFAGGDNTVNGLTAAQIQSRIDGAAAVPADWNALAANAQANFAATGVWFVTDPPGTPSAVPRTDWHALAAQAEAKFDASGDWGLLAYSSAADAYFIWAA